MICIGWDLFVRNIFVKDTEQWAYPSTAIQKDKLRKKFDREKGSKEESKGIAGLGEHERVVERSQADRHLLWHRPGRTHLKWFSHF